MKILIVNKFLHPNGGSETYIFGLGKALEKAGHEVQYFGMEHEGRIVGNRAGSYMKELDFHGGLLKNLTTPFKIVYSRDARKRIRAVLDDLRPDIVHLNNINFQITPSVIDEVKEFNKDIRILYTAHDYQWVCPNHQLRIPQSGELCDKCVGERASHCVRNECIHGSEMRSRLGAYEHNLYRKRGTYRLVDSVICPSDFMNGMLSRHPDLQGRCITLRNFVPDEMRASDNTFADDGTENGKDYILYFGRYDEEKGIRTLARVAAALPTVPFVCAGRGPLKEVLVRIPNITDVGFQEGEKLRALISGAKAVLFPSEWYENCPYSVMEAQILGVPVIASDLGGTPELIINGKTGTLCEAKDADGFVKAIGRIWNDDGLLADMRRASKEHALADYDTADGYVEKYLKICRGEWGTVL